MIISLMYLLFGLNLFKMLMEKTNAIYKDVRFWLILLSLGMLIWMTLQSYPVG